MTKAGSVSTAPDSAGFAGASSSGAGFGGASSSSAGFGGADSGDAGFGGAGASSAGFSGASSGGAGYGTAGSSNAGVGTARSSGAGFDSAGSGGVGFGTAGSGGAGFGTAGSSGVGFGSGGSSAGFGTAGSSSAGFGGAGFGNTGEQRRFDATGEQRRFDGTEQRRFDGTGEQRRIGNTGEMRRVGDTGEFRRFLDASEPASVPEAADRRQAGPPSRGAAIPEPPRQSRAVTVGIVLMSLFVLIAGGIVGVVYFTGNDDDLDSVLQLGAGESGKRTVSAPLDNRSRASFEMLAATNRVNVTIGELGDDLFRISTPEDAGFLPSPVLRNDDLKLQVTKDGDGTGGVIDVVLAAKVRWAVRLSGYAEEQMIDLSGGQVSGVEMVGGMRSAQLTLARPDGTVPIKVNGAVEKLVVKSPAGSPVRVKVGGGAKSVRAGNRTIKDVPPGSTLTPKNWAVPNRYDVGAGAPISALTVENG
ncbi:hypothetical protein OWR29_42230 [Actinoplanes sp. Pm04-4]|uniref:Uncharacterized protein n=1 Tax=Paractinoplanes pyxinae TaxID=2997416 RepID=A0ABT4BGG4_9ACTN|nr:hypothetical protein [Actinoplanes pyxinae]MCY1144658.1 hypothetical protein [Actinoplanes pyxinae]